MEEKEMEEQDKKQLETEREEDKEQENPMIRKDCSGGEFMEARMFPYACWTG